MATAKKAPARPSAAKATTKSSKTPTAKPRAKNKDAVPQEPPTGGLARALTASGRTAQTADELLAIGQEILRIPGYRPGQREAIDAILAGKDVLAVMPTGAGKSLLYQLPSLVLPGLTVVVSPLIALIKDQIDKMVSRGVPVVRIDSTLTTKQRREMDELALAPGGKLLLTTPERMADPEFRSFLKGCAGKLGVSRFVVDEAHCVSQWGHDFRPAYLSLRKAIDDLGRPPILATTATAPPHVREDILHQLGCEDATIVTTTFERANLHFEVIPFPSEDDKIKTLVTLLKKLPRPGIVYCATVKKVEDLAEALFRHGLPVTYYHGRLTKNERDANQQTFMESKDIVMVATNAFGLGVDKQDIRNVLHYHVPGSLEAYAQEAGRGGRDGKPARCVLLFSPDDVAIQEYFLSGSYPTRRQVNQVYAALEAFGKAPAGTRTPEQGPTIANIALGSGVGQQRTRTVLALFKEEKFVHELDGGYFELASPPPSPEVLRDRARQYEARRIADRQRLDALLAYVNAAGCRNQVILDYLGEPDAPACGRCDNCLRSRDAALAAAKESRKLGDSLTRLLDEEGETPVVASPKPARYKLIRVDETASTAASAASAPAGTAEPAGPIAPPAVATPPAASLDDEEDDDDEYEDEDEESNVEGDFEDDEGDEGDEDDEDDDYEDIQRTAAELAEEGYESEDAITILARKRQPKPPKTKRRNGLVGANGATPSDPTQPLAADAAGDGVRKKRRRRRKKKAVLPPPSAFSSPIITSVVAPPPRARYAGAPVVEYVRNPVRMNSAPAASANPNDAGRRRPGAFRPNGPGPSQRSGAPTNGSPGGAGTFVRRDAFVPGGGANPSGTGGGKRRRRRGRGGNGPNGPGGSGNQRTALAGRPSTDNGGNPAGFGQPAGGYGSYDGAPAAGGGMGMRGGFGGHLGTPMSVPSGGLGQGFGGGQPGGDGRRRRRRKRRGGGGQGGPSGGSPNGGAPPRDGNGSE